MTRTGYTLPVFAVAAAKAALVHLKSHQPIEQAEINILPDKVIIPVNQVALLTSDTSLAVTISDPGDNLDITRDTPIWAYVKISARQSQALVLEAGEGVGKTASGEGAIYSYARRLFDENLLPLINDSETVTVSIILPEGRQLAQRTSNAAFGILEGLSLLGTSGISQPLSAAAHLQQLRQNLQLAAKQYRHLVFCLGHNGMQVAKSLGINNDRVVQTGNWIGPLLVEAAINDVDGVLLLGYQGKLVKLAGGIFNTSSHLADGKLEIIAAAVAKTGGNLEIIHQVLDAETGDAAYKLLVKAGLALETFRYLATKISLKAGKYAQKYANKPLKVNTILFNRQGEIISSCSDISTLTNFF